LHLPTCTASGQLGGATRKISQTYRFGVELSLSRGNLPCLNRALSGIPAKITINEAKRWPREEEHVGPALILIRIPFVPLLSARIFPQDAISINRENTVSAGGANCSRRLIAGTVLNFAHARDGSKKGESIGSTLAASTASPSHDSVYSIIPNRTSRHTQDPSQIPHDVRIKKELRETYVHQST
jgi:hypothetical protein